MGISGDPDRPLLDREPELAGLQRAFREVIDGQGAAWSAKARRAAARPRCCGGHGGWPPPSGLAELSAAGGELERGFPFGVCRQLLAPALDGGDGEQRAALLTGQVAPAAAILGLNGSEPAIGADGYAAVHALYGLIARLAAERPLLIMVDDAHWADPSSLRALDYLARRLDELPVALVVAFRPDEPGGAAGAARRAERPPRRSA